MWIKLRNKTTRRILDRSLGMESPVVFSPEGKAKVTRELGDALVAKYSAITEVETQRAPAVTADDNAASDAGDQDGDDDDAGA